MELLWRTKGAIGFGWWISRKPDARCGRPTGSGRPNDGSYYSCTSKALRLGPIVAIGRLAQWRLLPSRPREFHPEPLAAPDMNLDSSGSCHRTKAAAFYRLSGSSCLSVGPIQRGDDRPLRSTDIIQLHHYYRAVRPYPAHRYFRPREHFDRKLPAVFASHCPFDTFDVGGNRTPIVLELLSAMLHAEPGLTTLPDNIVIGLPCVQLPGVNDLLPFREQKCRLNL